MSNFSKSKFMILCGLVGLFVGIAFGMLIHSVLLAICTAVVAGMAIGGVMDVRSQMPPDQFI